MARAFGAGQMKAVLEVSRAPSSVASMQIPRPGFCTRMAPGSRYR
jgi:hypothetical protein